MKQKDQNIPHRPSVHSNFPAFTTHDVPAPRILLFQHQQVPQANWCPLWLVAVGRHPRRGAKHTCTTSPTGVHHICTTSAPGPKSSGYRARIYPCVTGRGAFKRKEKVFLIGSFAKRRRVAHMFNHGWWRLTVGSWWRLAVGGGLWLAVGGSLGQSFRAVLKGGPQQKQKNLVPKGPP